jgi:hypothetical protein
MGKGKSVNGGEIPVSDEFLVLSSEYRVMSFEVLSLFNWKFQCS